MKLFKLVAALCLMAPAIAHAGDSDWRKLVSNEPAGKFPDLSSVQMDFEFGWSNVLKAAEAHATIQRKGAEYHAVVTGKTEGLARALWPLDAQHTAMIHAESLRPEWIAQSEVYRKSTIETEVRYDATGLNRFRKVSPSKDKPRWKRLNFEPVYDVISGILYVRSQPLKIGDKIGVVCFPGDSPYIAVVTVTGRESIRCIDKLWPALRLSLEVRKLEVKSKKPTDAVDYGKFKSGTIWVSDDALRLPLRAEVNIFVGFVYGELTGFEKL